MYNNFKILLSILTLSQFANGIEKKSVNVTKTAAIVGGRAVLIESVPYIVQLQTSSFFLCGGSILNKDFIITAAHCTFDIDRNSLTVRLGSDFRRFQGVVIGVSSVTEHPNYNSDTGDYDFSLIKLRTPISNFPNSKMMPIALASVRTDAYPGNVAFVSGWGQLSETSGRLSTYLQTAAVPIVAYDDCKRFYANENFTERMLCAGFPRQGLIDACQGMSIDSISTFFNLYHVN
jgi:secreted trypsin-like serine protease